MGGSFDPVHVAHVALAEVALRHLALDEVRWVPVGQAWQKARQLAPAKHRLAMVQAAIQHEPRFVLDDCEVRRGGPSYTLDTVRELQAQRPGCEWFLIIGQDQYANLPTWQGWEELLSRVTLAVACRGDDAPRAPAALKGRHRLTRLLDQRTQLDGGGLVPGGAARWLEGQRPHGPGAHVGQPVQRGDIAVGAETDAGRRAADRAELDAGGALAARDVGRRRGVGTLLPPDGAAQRRDDRRRQEGFVLHDYACR